MKPASVRSSSTARVTGSVSTATSIRTSSAEITRGSSREWPSRPGPGRDRPHRRDRALRGHRRVGRCPRRTPSSEGSRPPLSWSRIFASVVASAIGLAFWWALTEPLPVPPVILLGVAGAILFCAGLIAGNGGALAAPVAFLFSLFLGSLIATQLHQAFRPQTAPVDEFNGLISLHFPE